MFVVYLIMVFNPCPKQSIDEQQTNLETAIERCVSQYYVLVGHYPEKLKCFRKRMRFEFIIRNLFVDYQVQVKILL